MKFIYVRAHHGAVVRHGVWRNVFVSECFFSAFFILSFASVKSSTIWWHNIVSSQIDCTVVVGIDFVSLLYSCARHDCRQVTPSSPSPSQSQESILFHSFANWTDFQITWIWHAFDFVPFASVRFQSAHAEFRRYWVRKSLFPSATRIFYFIASNPLFGAHLRATMERWILNGPPQHFIRHFEDFGFDSTRNKFFERARARRNSQNDEFMMETAVDNMGCTIGMRAQI